LHDLLSFDLGTFDIFAIPQTRALLDQKLRSLDPIDDFWSNRLYDGSDWPSRVICDDLHVEYVRASSQIGVGRKRSPSEFGKRLTEEFDLLDPALRFRGKFNYLFLLKWLQLLSIDGDSQNPTLFSGVSSPRSVNLGAISIGMLASKSCLPDNLKNFIQQVVI
jgi:hypothetical protein